MAIYNKAGEDSIMVTFVKLSPWLNEIYDVDKIDYNRIEEKCDQGFKGITNIVREMQIEDYMRGLNSLHPQVTEDMISLEAMKKNLYPIIFTHEEAEDPNMKEAIDAAIEHIISKKIVKREEQEQGIGEQEQEENMDSISTIKDALIEKYTEIYGYYHACEYMPRLKNAQSYICQNQYSLDEFIHIRDESPSSNGKAGMVLTTEAICMNCSHNFTHKFIAKYCDIKYTYINRDSVLGLDTSSLNIEMKHGLTYQISIEGSFSKLKQFIDYAVSLYAEEDELVW